MVSKKKTYRWARFPTEVIRNAQELLAKSGGLSKLTRSICNGTTKDDVQWNYDSESEFFADYQAGLHEARISWDGKDSKGKEFELDISVYPAWNWIRVVAPERSVVEAVFNVFEESYPKVRINPENRKASIREIAKIFIGHGRSEQWRLLKDFLADQMKFVVSYYEAGARAGRTIDDVLKELQNEVSIAFLVFTAEDQHSDGTLHARENVIHEAGIFQGRLGLRRAIVVREEGCSEFSNLHGVHEIRFPKGKIKECFGDVVATIFREFGFDEEGKP